MAFTEIGRAAVPGPLVETAAAIPALLQALPDTAAAAEWLPQLAEGTKLGTLAVAATGTGATAGASALSAALRAGRLGRRYRRPDPARRG